jgi:hypothetical protein
MNYPKAIEIKPIYENVTKYIIAPKDQYELHLDFETALLNGQVGNPKHYNSGIGNFIRIKINGEDIDFKDDTESVLYLKKYIDIVL